MRFSTLLALCAFAPSVATAAPMRFEETEITGEYLKPEITVVISRENLNKNYEVELKASFIEKILKSVDEQPF